MRAMAMKKGQKLSEGNKGDFLSSIKEECRKVTWTPKDELMLYTKIAVGATFALGVMIYSYDLVIRGSLMTIGALVRLLVG